MMKGVWGVEMVDGSSSRGFGRVIPLELSNRNDNECERSEPRYNIMIEGVGGSMDDGRGGKGL